MTHDGQARLMDLHRGQFFALDSIGTQMLSLALERDGTELVSRIAAEYGATPEQVQRDWARLSRDLQRDGLLEVTATHYRPRTVPGRLRLLFLLTLAWFYLRLFGWVGTVRLWRRVIKPASKGSPIIESGQVVETVGRAVQEAAAGHLLNTECKERALVAWRVLREDFGLPAELVVGAIPYPFQAHAWVECGPWTITDERANCNAFTRVARFA
jgi:hypothetical protein